MLSNNRENVWLRDIMAVVLETLNDPVRVRELSVEADEFVAKFRDTAWRLLFPADLCEAANNVRAVSTFTSLREDMFDALPMFLPNFRLVNIVRDGVEVVASRLKHAHIAGAGDFHTHCVAWAHCTDIIHWFQGQPSLKERFFLVRHEQLLDDELCREVFGRIQHRFGLDRCDDCERFVKENFVSRNEDSGHSPRTLEGAESRKADWQTWSVEQRRTFEEVCGVAMNELGYPIPW